MKLFASISVFCIGFALMLSSCTKEYSQENGGKVVIGEGTAEGTLSGAPSNCSNIQLLGAYAASLPTDSSDKVIIEMNFTKAGTYNISTDTLNGIYFSNSGTVSTTGTTSITLFANGTPTGTGAFIYTVKFKGSACSFTCDILTLAPSNGTDYFPTTANSFWKYASSNPAAQPKDTLRNLSTNNIFTINTDSYNLFTSSNSAAVDSLFFRKVTGEYHQFGDMDIAGVASNVVPADYIFLKDNVPAGTSWESPVGNAIVNSVSVNLKLTFTITGKSVNVTIGNVVFKDVIKVTTAEQVQLPAGYTTVLTYETWYAKGVGIINLTAAAPFYGYQVQQYQVF